MSASYFGSTLSLDDSRVTALCEDPAALDAAIRGVLVAADVDVVFLTHPALLPRFGGPGMYGDRVFEAVLEAGEAESGVSIHLVDADYDSGASDSLEDLKARVRAREKDFVVETLGQIARGERHHEQSRALLQDMEGRIVELVR